MLKVQFCSSFNCIKVCNKKIEKVIDLSAGQSSVDKNIRFRTIMLQLDLCDYGDACIVKGRVTVTGDNNANRKNKKLTFKNNAPLGHTYQKSITQRQCRGS